MKKLFYLFFSFCLFGLTITGCHENKLKTVKGEVVNLDILNDSILANLVLSVDGDSLVFSLKEAQYINSGIFSGDSVEIDYIEGKTDTLRAMLISIISKSANIIIPSEMAGDSLVTIPAEQLIPSVEPSDSTGNK